MTKEELNQRFAEVRRQRAAVEQKMTAVRIERAALMSQMAALDVKLAGHAEIAAQFDDEMATLRVKMLEEPAAVEAAPYVAKHPMPSKPERAAVPASELPVRLSHGDAKLYEIARRSGRLIADNPSYLQACERLVANGVFVRSTLNAERFVIAPQHWKEF